MSSSCIQVSDGSEAKKCISVSSNFRKCPIITGYYSVSDTSVEVPSISRLNNFNCTTHMYSITNWQSNARYSFNCEYGEISYMTDGLFTYKPPRVNVPSGDIKFSLRARVGGNVTEWVEVSAEKLTVSPIPVLGVASLTNAYKGAYVDIPIVNYVVGTSIYTDITVDNGYAIQVSGTITWVFDQSVEYNKQYNLSFRAFNDCMAESELCTFQISSSQYEYLEDLPSQDDCPPLCADGWYFDCATESCKEYAWYKLSPTGSGGVAVVQTSEGEKIYSQDSMHPWDWGFIVSAITRTTKISLIGGNYISYDMYQLSRNFEEYQDLNALIDIYLIDSSLLYTSPSTSSSIYNHNQTVQTYSVVINIPLALTFGN